MKNRRFVLKRLAAGGALTVSAGFLAACGQKASEVQFHSVDITGADYAKGFDLTDFNGKERSLADFKGDVVVVFFGYTQCPDVCPATLGQLAQVKHELGADGDRLQVLFISLDPQRDTPEVLKAYMGAFDPGFLALYTDSKQGLDALTKKFKIYYKQVDGDTPGHYTIDHTAASYVYDPQGRVRLFTRYGTSVPDLTADIRLLLNGA